MVGYAVVPVLFQTLSKSQAGVVAGILFVNVYWIGIAASITLFILSYGFSCKRLSRIFYIILSLMLVLALIQLFIIHPMVVEVKALIKMGESQAKSHFSMLHASSSILYLIMSLFGIALLYYRRKEGEQPVMEGCPHG